MFWISNIKFALKAEPFFILAQCVIISKRVVFRNMEMNLRANKSTTPRYFVNIKIK